MKSIIASLLGFLFTVNVSLGLKITNYQPNSVSNDFSIGDVEINTTKPGVSDGLLTIENEIGPSVEAYNATVILLDHDCNELKPKTGLEIEISNDEYVDTSAPFSYNIEVQEELILSSPGGFIELVGASETVASDTIKGNICFCTRVSTYSDGIQVRSQDNWFNLTFKLKEDDINITRFSINKHWFDSNVYKRSSGAEICICDDDFNCLQTQTISSQDPLVVCLNPFCHNYFNLDSIKITNFNMRISTLNDEITYEFVSLGTSSWDPDTETEVTTDSQSNKIKVSTTLQTTFFDPSLLGPFFEASFNTLNLKGNVFLEIKESFSESSHQKTFNMTLLNENRLPIWDGSIRRIVDTLVGFFSSVVEAITNIIS